MSVLYLTFIPQLPLPTPRSRSVSSRTRNKREGQMSSDGKMSPLSGTVAPVEDEETSHTDAIDCGGSVIDAKLKVTIAKGLEEDGGEATDSSEGKDAQRVQSPDERRNTDQWAKLRQCAEVVSLCRVRDAMGKGMEPMMGLLK